VYSAALMQLCRDARSRNVTKCANPRSRATGLNSWHRTLWVAKSRLIKYIMGVYTEGEGIEIREQWNWQKDKII